MGQFLGFIRKAAQIGLVAVIVSDELEACGRYAAAIGLHPRHHAHPVGMPPSAMAGVERKAA